jgi:CO/xanthine dehydrogenase Mo-binding subunit
MVYATEAHLEEIAATVGIDAIELRRRNIFKPGDRGPSGELLADPGIADCLDAVTARLEAWRQDAPAVADGKRRGYGLACAWWLTTGAPSAATIVMNEDGSANVHTGSTEIGTGAVVSGVAAIAARELGLPVERVHVVSGSTGDGPHDAGSKGSRTMYGAGNAVLKAAREVVTMLAEEVADHLEAAPADIDVSGGRIGVRGTPDTSMTVAEAVQLALNKSGPVVGKGRYRGAAVPLAGSTLSGLRFDAFNEPTFHCHGVELELEDETGRIDVTRYVAAHDVGPVLNPAGARGQVEGGVVQGLGYALTEILDVSDTGEVRNPNLVDYRLPTIADAPEVIETIFIEGHPGPTGPFGAKGVGEAPVILPAAAVGSALRQLSGRQPEALPMDATRVAEFLDHVAVREQ